MIVIDINELCDELSIIDDTDENSNNILRYIGQEYEDYLLNIDIKIPDEWFIEEDEDDLCCYLNLCNSDKKIIIQYIAMNQYEDIIYRAKAVIELLIYNLFEVI